VTRLRYVNTSTVKKSVPAGEVDRRGLSSGLAPRGTHRQRSWATRLYKSRKKPQEPLRRCAGERGTLFNEIVYPRSIIGVRQVDVSTLDDWADSPRARNLTNLPDSLQGFQESRATTFASRPIPSPCPRSASQSNASILRRGRELLSPYPGNPCDRAPDPAVGRKISYAPRSGRPADEAAPALPPLRPYGQITKADPNLMSPRILQCNLIVERNFGPGQLLSVSYVGTQGRNLMKTRS